MLVLVIGLKLLADWGFNSDWSFAAQPRMQAMLGGWKQSFAALEEQRTACAHRYDEWLHDNWIFTIPLHEQPANRAGAARPICSISTMLRRPEAMAFWLFMVLAFASGFLPPRKRPAEPAAA